MRRMIGASTTTEQIGWHEEMVALKNDIDGRTKDIFQLCKNNLSMTKQLNTFVEYRKKYLLIRDEQILPSIYAKDEKKVSTLVLGEQSDISEENRSIVQKLSSISEEHDKEIILQSKETVDMLKQTFIIIGAIAFLFSILCSLFLVKIISKPLKELSAIMEKVAYGDLTVTVQPKNRFDEIGVLWLSFSMMVGTLRMVTKETSEIVEELSKNIASGTPEKDASVITADFENIQNISNKLTKLLGEYKL